VIGRISDDTVLLDLRTVEPEFDATLVLLLRQLARVPIVSNPLSLDQK